MNNKCPNCGCNPHDEPYCMTATHCPKCGYVFKTETMEHEDNADGMNEIRVKVDGGVLIATKCADSHYPGIDIEFVPDNDEEDDVLTRPRILVERPNGGQLVAMIWGDRMSEDYSDKIVFDEK